MSARDLLCCDLAAGRIAVPLERVIGVAEGGVVTPLPYSAPSFEGLVEVFGQVMPQVGLASLLALPRTAGGILVVVSDRGGSLALRVTGVTGMVQVDGDNLARTTNQARTQNPLYIAQFEHQGFVHNVLDLDLLATSDGLDLSAPDGAVLLPDVRREELSATEPEREYLPVLLVEIAGDRYAIPNQTIVELNVPGGVRGMPNAPDWILGLIDIRGQPVVAVSTAALLGRPQAAEALEVCLIAELEHDLPVALFVDRAIGLERVSPGVIHPLPQPMAGMSGYFVHHERDIVGLIDPRHLLSQVASTVREAVPRQPATPQEVAQSRDAGQYQRLLSLRVGRELYAMTLDRIERILASVRLTPLPSDIAYFDGMADVGDAIVPVIDLRRQVGEALQPFDTTERPPCILTTLEGAMMGILVDQVLSIIDVSRDRLEPVRDASRLPISHVVSFEGRLIALLTIDRLLPPVTKAKP